MFKYYYEFASTFKFMQMLINCSSIIFSLIRITLILIMLISLILHTIFSDSKPYCKIIRYIVIGLFFLIDISYPYLKSILINIINILYNSNNYKLNDIILFFSNTKFEILFFDYLLIFIILLTSSVHPIFKIIYPTIIFLPLHTHIMTLYINQILALPMDLFFYTLIKFFLNNHILWISFEFLYYLIIFLAILGIILFKFINHLIKNPRLYKLFTIPYPLFIIGTLIITFCLSTFYLTINILYLTL